MTCEVNAPKIKLAKRKKRKIRCATWHSRKIVHLCTRLDESIKHRIYDLLTMLNFGQEKKIPQN